MNKPIQFAAPSGVRRRLLHEEVAEHLRRMITEETLPEGSRIDEVELCQLLDISRTPLREALKVLQSEGLILIEPHKGARVATISDEELNELFEVLAGLERQAAEMSALRASDEQIAEFEAMHEVMAQYHHKAEALAYFELNQRIHQWVIDLCGNRELQQVHRRLSGRTRRGRYLTTLRNTHWDESVSEHLELLDAIKTRDAQRAGRILRDHVLKTGETISSLSNQS